MTLRMKERTPAVRAVGCRAFRVSETLSYLDINCPKDPREQTKESHQESNMRTKTKYNEHAGNT